MCVTAVRDDLERKMDCLDVFECIFGLNERDQLVFQMIQQSERPLTVNDVADQLGCERSTAYRSISRLLDAEIVTQEQVNYEQGGYYYVYRPRPSEELAHDMQRLLNDWYATIRQLIQEFEDRYTRDSGERESNSVQSCY
jgi:predicted transcriptional regulator